MQLLFRLSFHRPANWLYTKCGSETETASTRPTSLGDSRDDIFNSQENIEDNKTGMFVQDDWANLGLGAEMSRSKFCIYDKTIFEKIDKDNRYDDYLKDLEVIYINPYTGTMINK